MSGFYVGLVLLALGSAFQSSRLYGFVTLTVSGDTCRRTLAWEQPTNLRWYRNTISFPGGSRELSALVSAWSRWNAGAANINIGTFADSGGLSLSDGKSSIWFSTSLLGTDVPGRTYWSATNRCKMAEADIIFNANIVYGYTENAQHIPYNGSTRNFIGVAIHEFGHALGLQHENRYYNMMGDDSTHVTRGYNSATYYGPGEDANNGAATVYGEGSGRPDIGVTVMRYLGTSGEYSAHRFGVVRTSTGGNVPFCPQPTIQGQYCNSVKKGTTYSMEVTIENNGTAGTPPSIPIKLYLNSNINLTIRSLLANKTVTTSRNTPYETTLSFTVPTTARSKTYYYVSAEYVRPSGYSESTALNNMGFIPIYVE